MEVQIRTLSLAWNVKVTFLEKRLEPILELWVGVKQVKSPSGA